MRLLIALLLLFAVTPGVAEVVESAVHVVHHGDLPHHEGRAGCDEHACTAMFHACGCHAPMSAQSSTATATSAPAIERSTAGVLALATAAGRSDEPPPLPPPIRA